MGIARFDYENSHGWYARHYFDNNTISKFYADKKWGGRDKALKMAEVWLKGVKVAFPSHFDLSDQPAFRTTIPKNNKTGIVGVYYSEYIDHRSKRLQRFFAATWCKDKKGRNKKFCIGRKRSYRMAFEEAISYRKKKEEELSNGNTGRG